LGDIERVPETHVLPFRRICSLLVSEPGTGATEVATGWFFGRDMIVTADHIFQPFARPVVTVWPGRNEHEDTPFGAWTTKDVKRSPAGDADYAAIFVSQPVGDSVGTFGIASLGQSLRGARVEVSGYAGIDHGDSQWDGIGRVITDDGAEFQYDILTRSGQSGSPVWLVGNSDDLVGLHVADNKALRFTEGMVTQLLTWRDAARV
jgi:glutamyl endopeptidase